MPRLSLAALALIASLLCLGVHPAAGQGKRFNLWAAMSVSRPIFQKGQAEHVSITFAIVNDGHTTVNPMFGPTRLFINGTELKEWNLISSNGPKSSYNDALPPGHFIEFGYDFGKYFERPGIYILRWEGPAFSATEITFRVMPVSN